VKRSIWLIALVFGLAAALPASAQIYQWKDKDGKTHFSDRPPPNQPGVQPKIPKRPQPAVEPEPDETGAEDAKPVEGGAEPNNAAAPGKSQAEQRDEEFQKRRAAAAEAREKAEKEAADREKREQDCQRARTQHSALSSGQRVSRLTEDGSRRFLNDEERAAEIARSEELIKAFCGED
jgi:hypothetical protein